MLTRLKVKGFKNLADVDVRFGPFTCIAGANGVGKSNLFDAIALLSALADRPLVEAALSIRGGEGYPGDPTGLFQRIGSRPVDEMSFEAEMIIPSLGMNDLGEEARARATFLRYNIVLGRRGDASSQQWNALQILKEELRPIPVAQAPGYLPFPHTAAWRGSVIKGSLSKPLISTSEAEGKPFVRLHPEAMGRSSSPFLPAVRLPRTLLATAWNVDWPTLALVQAEMRSWRQLHLEPSALRRPDELTAPVTLGSDGSHLPAALYHLASTSGRNGKPSSPEDEQSARVYAAVANRLFGLIDDVREVSVRHDDARQLLTLFVTQQGGVSYPAQALSDGTLRFLALAVLAESSDYGVFCVEEPENGIHPERIPAMLRLLRDIATDVGVKVGPDNPLRQVIVNTHAPGVVAEAPQDSLVVAEPIEAARGGTPYRTVRFSGLDGTWRQQTAGERRLGLGRLLAYLSPIRRDEPEDELAISDGVEAHRVVDRPDVQSLLFPPDGG